VAEVGYPGYEATNWYAYVVPARTPKEIVNRLNRELVQALGAPDVVALLHKQGLEPRPGTPEALGQFMEREFQTWGKVVKASGMKAE